MTKSTKSHLRGLSSLLKNSFRVHELVARAVRGKCVRQMAERKPAILPLSAISYYHACEHITRKNRADSCTHCLHARYKCRAGVGEVCALTGWKENFLFCLLVVFGFYIVGELTHMRSMCVGVAETGVEHCSPAIIHKSTFPVLLPWLVFSTLSRTFSPWRKFSLRGQGWRRPFSCASSSFRIARPVYSCECLNPARDNPASAR